MLTAEGWVCDVLLLTPRSRVRILLGTLVSGWWLLWCGIWSVGDGLVLRSLAS